MKKYILLSLALLCGIVVAEQTADKHARASSYIGETVGTTNYLGVAITTQNTSGTPNISNEVWRITRTITDASGNIISINHAYNGNYTGNVQLWKNAWTNRANATYK